MAFFVPFFPASGHLGPPNTAKQVKRQNDKSTLCYLPHRGSLQGGASFKAERLVLLHGKKGLQNRKHEIKSHPPLCCPLKHSMNNQNILRSFALRMAMNFLEQSVGAAMAPLWKRRRHLYGLIGGGGGSGYRPLLLRPFLFGSPFRWTKSPIAKGWCS